MGWYGQPSSASQSVPGRMSLLFSCMYLWKFRMLRAAAGNGARFGGCARKRQQHATSSLNKNFKHVRSRQTRIHSGQVWQQAAPPGREDALLLSYSAAQNASLFAAQCFVETVLDAYTRGENVDELQTAMQVKNLQQSGALLNPMEQDLVLSWIIIVMLTAKEIGVTTVAKSADQQQQQADQEQQLQQGSSNPAAGISQQYSGQVLGLLQFVKQATKLYFEEGYTVQQLQSLQAAVSSDPGQGQSQFLQMMQQYTRLVMITLEVAASSNLPTQQQLNNPTSLDAPSGYTAAFMTRGSSGDSNKSEGLITAAAVAAGRDGKRALAVRLMTAFVGAALGAQYAMRSFIVHALEAYEAGIPVPDLHQQLQPGEFLQSGGLLPVGARPEMLQGVNQQLFGRWLSMVYMAAAQLNAVFPGAADKPGWAWYGGEDEVQANAMANFVAQTLARLQEESAAAVAQGEEADRVAEDPLAAKIKSTPGAAAGLAEISKQLQQEFQEQGTLRGKAVPAMVKVPDADLESTSPALRVWRQQVELVQAVHQYMMAVQGLNVH